MRYNSLGVTGLRVSELGFGAAPLGDEYGAADPQEMKRALHFAIENGINFIDVAPYYGRTLAEARLGEMLQGRRQEVILATKCARYDTDGFDFSPAGIRRSVDQSLQRLKTDYVDIMHVHDVEFGCKRQIVEETIPQLRRIQEQGKARFIGITGLSLKMLRQIADAAPVDCILSYCRYTLLNRDLDSKLTPFARSRQVGLLNASPLHMRLLAETGPPEWHPAPAEVKAAAKDVVELCRRYGANASRIALQFALQHSYVSSTFVGISTVDEARNNLEAISDRPDPKLLLEIEKLAAPVQGMTWVTGYAENH
ncbi:MAG TPA: aldo/keto reductase [Bryobacteraceae bacterium]|nr:aldo/keto reductase [Bryobacteraceae bacterium]